MRPATCNACSTACCSPTAAHQPQTSALHEWLLADRPTQHQGSGCLQGLWKNDKPDGPGRYCWKNKDEYDGEWRTARMHGQGTFKWSSGAGPRIAAFWSHPMLIVLASSGAITRVPQHPIPHERAHQT